jgi:hypothetical protein
MGKKTSIYLSDDLARAVEASGKTIPALIRLGLEGGERARSDRLADQVEKLARALQEGGYRLVPPADDAAALAAELAALAGRMNKLAGRIGP